MGGSAADVLKMTARNPESVSFGPALSDKATRLGVALESKGPFRFVPGDGLWQDGRPVALPPRAIGVLSVLLQTPGAVVSKQAIMDAVWPDTFVTDSSLLEAIGLVRATLGDDPKQAVYIQTVHRRGYRFIGQIEPGVSGASRASRASSASRAFSALDAPGAPDALDARDAPFFSGPEWRPIVAACVSYVVTTVCVAIIFAVLGPPRHEPLITDTAMASPGFAISHSGGVVYVPQVGSPITPSWTVDGLELALAFSKAGPFTLLTLPAGTPLLASSGGKFPTSWSPDRALLAYTEYQPLTGVDIWVLDVRTGIRRALTRTPFDETWARFSPDGRWIAYMSNETGRWEVYVRPPAEGGRRVRVSGNGGAWPSWSNDSATVFFSAADATLAATIHAAPALVADAPVVVHQGASRTPARAELRVVLEWFSELTKRQS